MNNNPKVIFRIIARNAEQTLSRAADSIYAQNYDNIEIHFVDNASEDNTYKIMQEYEKKDPRVRVFRNDANYVWKEGNRFTDYYHEYDLNNTYMCYLDADDEYKPEFLEKMLPFATDNNLDIAACGYDYIDEITGQLYEEKRVTDKLIIEGAGFGSEYTKYYPFMRARWGKLYKAALAGIIETDDNFDRLYGGDTFETTEYFRKSKRAGMYPEALLKYYYNPGTISYKWHIERVESDRVLIDLAMSYLKEKAGEVSRENEEYLAGIYFAAIILTTERLQKSDIPEADKFNILYDILTCSYTVNITAPVCRFQEQRDEWFQKIINYIVMLQPSRNAANYDKLIQIFYITKTLPLAFPGWEEDEIIKLMSGFTEKYEDVPAL